MCFKQKLTIKAKTQKQKLIYLGRCEKIDLPGAKCIVESQDFSSLQTPLRLRQKRAIVNFIEDVNQCKMEIYVPHRSKSIKLAKDWECREERAWCPVCDRKCSVIVSGREKARQGRGQSQAVWSAYRKLQSSRHPSELSVFRQKQRGFQGDFMKSPLPSAFIGFMMWAVLKQFLQGLTSGKALVGQ